MNKKSVVSVRQLHPEELEWANLRYAEIDFVPSLPTDYVALAEVDGRAVGLGRVVPITDEIGELGGMYVFPEQRGGGISKAIIAHLIAAVGRTSLYCLPFEELRALYESAEFRVHTGLDGVPSKIVEKHRWCNEHYPKPVLLMCRDMPNDSVSS